jgi:membrane-associated protease RseP (regulator of RpoE activity)
MSLGRCALWLAAPVVLLTVGSVLQAGEGQDAAKSEKSDTKEPTKKEAETRPLGSYWIGIMAAPIDPLLKAHLRLDTGVVVQHVVPDSPAAKAGIKEDDLVLKFGDTPAPEPAALSQAVEKNKDREATVTLLREGREITIKVTPRERPAEMGFPDQWQDPNWNRFHEWLNKLRKGETPQEDPFRMYFFRPGFMLPEGAKGHAFAPFRGPKLKLPMPPNTSVAVTKTDQGPAKIVIGKDGKTWEATEDELDKLPPDVRHIAEGVLGGNFAFAFPGGWFRFDAEERREAKSSPDRAESGIGRGRDEKRLEGILKRLDELHRQQQDSDKRHQRELEKLRRELEQTKKTGV